MVFPRVFFDRDVFAMAFAERFLSTSLPGTTITTSPTLAE
jgi:hypothetical protein